MALDVAVYFVSGHGRSNTICEAMVAGISRVGDQARLLCEDLYAVPDTPVAVFYGFVGQLPRIMHEYRSRGLKAVYVDLGYWGRHAGGRRHGYHKVSVNDRHPTEYFMRRPHDSGRADALQISVQPWRDRGSHILLAGMGPKAAAVEGYGPEQWERAAIAQIRSHTNRPIIYRPKPSWKAARPIEGAAFSPVEQDLNAVLADCAAVVTHHSNVAVEAIVAGIPALCMKGVAKPMAGQDFEQIENLPRPEGRQQWVNDISYVQWSVAEMREGLAWRYLKDAGLVP